MSKRILFVSSVNLTTNPRIYKEIVLATSLGYDVSFVGFKLGNWSDAKDASAREAFPNMNIHYLDATRKHYFQWLYYSVVNFICRFAWRFNKGSILLSAIAHSKRSLQLGHYFNKSKDNYTVVVAHTLAALYPSFLLAKKLGCRFAFDVEDYHPGEWIRSDMHNEKKRRELLLKNMLPGASYISAASGLIAREVEKLVPGVKVIPVLNFFPAGEFVPPSGEIDGKLRLVWFSQNINAGRGLELILTVWPSLRNEFELTLIGKADPEFYDKWLKDCGGIIIREPLHQAELHRTLSLHDIGLAIDVDTVDYNRSLAITNKILAYFQAGLYILATDTPAQTEFINTHPAHGMTAAQLPSSIQEMLQQVSQNREIIRRQKNTRFTRAAVHSWETESAKLKNEWEKLPVL